MLRPYGETANTNDYDHDSHDTYYVGNDMNYSRHF